MRILAVILFALGCSIHSQKNECSRTIKTDQVYKSEDCEIIFYADSMFIMNCPISDAFSYGRWETNFDNSVLLNTDYLPFESPMKQFRDINRVSTGFVPFSNAQIVILSSESIEMLPNNFLVERMRFKKVGEKSEKISRYLIEIKEMEKDFKASD